MNGSMTYYFVPVVRRGLAATIRQNPAGRRAEIKGKLHVAGSGDADVSEQIETGVQLYGPGEIRGIDPRDVVRTDPRPNVGDFEPNYFPFIEFADPDYLWRYTPAAGDATGLTSWITLIVLEQDEFEETSRGPTGKEKDSEIPQTDSEDPWIKVRNSRTLPDLNWASRWAHVQVTGDEGLMLDAEEFARLYAATPEQVVSRLLCARRLKPGTAYDAFVVPTFKLGCVAAKRAVMLEGDTALTLAWNKEADSEVELPYLFRWHFSTGRRGDFEYLVRLLEPRKLKDLGIRPMDCSEPGFGIPAVDRLRDDPSLDPSLAHVLDFEGALKSVGVEFTKWGKDNPLGAPTEFQELLAVDLLNKPYTDLASRVIAIPSGETDSVHDVTASLPTVVPPIYGRWHAGRLTVNPNGTAWVDELNLDPRHRAAAGFGALVIEQQQEALMASAWDQLGQIDEANEVLRRAQLGREAADGIFRKLGALSRGDFLRATAAVHSRIRFGETTVGRQLTQSRIPAAAFDPAFRRVQRIRGPLRKRQGVHPRDGRPELLDRLASGMLTAAGPAPRPHGIGVCDVTLSTILLESPGTGSGSGSTVTGMPTPVRRTKVGFPGGAHGPGTIQIPPLGARFCEEFITCQALDEALRNPLILQGLSFLRGETVHGDLGGREAVLDAGNEAFRAPQLDQSAASSLMDLNFLRKAICDVLEGWLKATPPAHGSIESIELDKIYDVLKSNLNPRIAITERVNKRLHVASEVPEREDPLGSIFVSPEFPQPMYEPLRDISQDLILPGIERVPQNTLAIVKTNGRFVESYMAALNHAFTGELFWRGAPVSGRWTYFRQFWDVKDYVPTEDELNDLLRRFLVDQKGVYSVSSLSSEEKEKILSRNRNEVGDTSELDGIQINTLVEGLLKEELLNEKLKDIKPIHEWGVSQLGNNSNRPKKEQDENLVLLVRGDLLKKYPSTLVYAVPADNSSGNLNPALKEFLPENGDEGLKIFPVFTGALPPDLTFFGFPFTENDARGISKDGRHPKYDHGVYFVLEERVSEARFGLDVNTEGTPVPPKTWDELNWGHLSAVVPEGSYIDNAQPDESQLDNSEPKWRTSSAAIAYITVQKPVRIAVYADQMLLKPL